MKEKKISLKQFIFEKLEKEEAVTDFDICYFLGYEPNYNTIESYKESYRKLKRDIEFFKDKDIERIAKIRGRYVAILKNDEGAYYASKEYKDYWDKSQEPPQIKLIK
jgi:hypothetical protein